MKNELLEQRNFLTPKELSEIFDRQVFVTTINILIKEGKIGVRLYPSRYRTDSGSSPVRNVRSRAHPSKEPPL